jgi:hypothetical protein
VSSEQPTPYVVSLVLHQGEKPGWRVHTAPSSDPDGYPVTIKHAEELARAATDVVSGADVTPFEVVRQGTVAMRQTVTRELAEAEAKAAGIAALRRTLAEIES